MKVYASRRDDILKRKAEYDKVFNERKERYNKQYQEYRDEDNNRSNQLIDKIRSELGDIDPAIDVKVSQNFVYGYDPSYSVYIGDESDKFDDNKPLSWCYRVSIDSDGNVSKESSSWSGLRATSSEHIQKLRSIVDVLDKINNIDWSNLLSDITPPDYFDYVTENDPQYDRDKPNFDKELLEADVEDLIGTDSWVLCNGSKYYKGDVYRRIIKATPAQFTVTDIPAYHVNDGEVRFGVDHWNDPYTIRRSTFMSQVVNPLKIVELH